MRVLVLASTYPRWPGDQQPAFIHDFCRHLPDCSVHVLVPGAAGAAATECIDGVRVHRFRYAPVARWQQLAYGGGMLANVRANPLLFLLLPIFLGAMLFAAWRLVRRERIDIVHAHWIIPQGVAAAILRRLLPRSRLVVTAHGGDAYAFHGRIGRAVKRFVLNGADTVTVVSSQLRDDLQRDLQTAPAPVVEPMGIDLSRFEYVAGGAPATERRFCFVGRLVEKKGVSDLLEAWARARQQQADLPPLLIAGDGPLRAPLETRAQQLGISDGIRFSGWITPAEVPALMAASLAVLVPSVTAADGDREGLGLVAVEALASGTPVIAYDYGAIRDVVTPGIHGVLVPQGDIAALAQALRDAANGQLPVVDEEKRRQITGHFGWQAVGAAYRKLYAALTPR